jgi:hypothetical protein
MPTLVRSNRLFPNHAQIGSFSETIPVVAGTTVSFTADQLLVVADPMNPGQFLQYSFLFWNAIGNLGSGLSTTMTIPAGDSVATAWYLQVGGPGGGGFGVATYAFSNELDLVLPVTPIQSVTPAAAWAGGNATNVATSNAVQITAKNTVAGTPPGGSFAQWFQFGNGVPAGNVLSVPAKGSSLAIASYEVPDKPDLRYPGILELVNALENVIRRIDPSDPAPIDLARLVGQIRTQLAAQQVGTDELTQIVAQIDRMDATQLKGALVDLQSKTRRIDAATKLLNDAIKAQGGR